MNITLSLPEDLVRLVRKIAVDRDTTLTGLVREYLNEVAREEAAAGARNCEACITLGGKEEGPINSMPIGLA